MRTYELPCAFNGQTQLSLLSVLEADAAALPKGAWLNVKGCDTDQCVTKKALTLSENVALKTV